MTKNKDQIVFVNQSSGYLMIDIIRAHDGLYDEYALLAGSIHSRNNKLPEHIKIDYLVKYNRKSKFKRLLSWVIGFIQILWIIKTRYRNAFLFIVTNPPLAVFIPFFCKNKYSILFYDIFPDALTELNIFSKSSILVRLWKKANKLIISNATRIITISNGMRKLIEQYSEGRVVEVIPIWTDNNFFFSIPRQENVFLIQHGLCDKFIVLYSGNLGITHDVDVIIDLAENLQNDNVFFVIIGGGEKYALISSEISNRALNNCMILPLQPSHILPHSFSAADIAIVTLSKNASHLSVPSKTYNYLSVGAPLLCIADKKSEIGELVEKYSVGMCFSKNEINGMREYILKVKNNSNYQSVLKRNAFTASLDYGVENAKKFISNV